MQTLNNGMTVPTNGDPYNLTADLAAMGESAFVITPVSTQAARDAIAGKKVGTTVRRLDKGGRTEYWDGAAWISNVVQADIGQGANTPILKALEVAVPIDAFSVGKITFVSPFPNKLVSVSLTRNHSEAGTVSFTVLSGASHPETGKAGIKFVVTGASSLASTTAYIYYTAWGY